MIGTDSNMLLNHHSLLALPSYIILTLCRSRQNVAMLRRRLLIGALPVTGRPSTRRQLSVDHNRALRSQVAMRVYLRLRCSTMFGFS
jgi:hypothetical protein